MNSVILHIIKREFTNASNIARHINSLPNNLKQSKRNVGNFVPLYKFPYIVPFSLINRLKVYQTALTTFGLPLALGLNQLNYISSDAVQYTSALGLTGCLALYSLGYLTKDFIGFIYYNEENDMVKVSYTDFWGKRKDIELPSKDIIPLSEQPVTPLNGLYHTFRRYSTQKTLKLNLRFGIIFDRDKIKNIL